MVETVSADVIGKLREAVSGLFIARFLVKDPISAEFHLCERGTLMTISGGGVE